MFEFTLRGFVFVPDFHPVDGKGRVQPVCASLPCVPANPDRCYFLLPDYEPVRWLVESFHGLVRLEATS